MRYKVNIKLRRLILVFLITFLFCGEVEAKGVDAVITVMKNSAEIVRICNLANTTCNKKILNYNASSGELTFSNSLYNELSSSEKTSFMETALLTTKKSSLPKVQKNKVYKFISSQDSAVSGALQYLQSDTNADLVSARAWFAPFSGPISTIMGIACIIVATGLSLSILFDVCFLTIPTIELLLSRGDSSEKPWGISIEAWRAHKEALMDESSEGALQIYFKKRVVVFLIASLILAWLVSNKVYSVFLYFVDAFNF